MSAHCIDRRTQDMELIHPSQLPLLGMSHEFVGAEHGGVCASFFLVIGD
jgi:hypothetical protein